MFINLTGYDDEYIATFETEHQDPLGALKKAYKIALEQLNRRYPTDEDLPADTGFEQMLFKVLERNGFKKVEFTTIKLRQVWG